MYLFDGSVRFLYGTGSGLRNVIMTQPEEREHSICPETQHTAHSTQCIRHTQEPPSREAAWRDIIVYFKYRTGQDLGSVMLS